jgi:hypothetical protein
MKKRRRKEGEFAVENVCGNEFISTFTVRNMNGLRFSSERERMYVSQKVEKNN